MSKSKKCLWCGDELTGRQTKFCSKNHKSNYYVTQHRKNIKERAVAYKGGACERCGYSKSLRALVFHHDSPEEKDFGISSGGLSRSWSRVKKELDKTVLLCSNCHAEVHEEIDVG